mmetsp:Transcript_28294/g.65673  ORF Transcript_28294/g.65673 Transcript_28294/m.65673 type:complete len:241 (-) Transcript_28294:184-906(-)
MVVEVPPLRVKPFLDDHVPGKGMAGQKEQGLHAEDEPARRHQPLGDDAKAHHEDHVESVSEERVGLPVPIEVAQHEEAKSCEQIPQAPDQEVWSVGGQLVPVLLHLRQDELVGNLLHDQLLKGVFTFAIHKLPVRWRSTGARAELVNPRHAEERRQALSLEVLCAVHLRRVVHGLHHVLERRPDAQVQQLLLARSRQNVSAHGGEESQQKVEEGNADRQVKKHVEKLRGLPWKTEAERVG